MDPSQSANASSGDPQKQLPYDPVKDAAAQNYKDAAHECSHCKSLTTNQHKCDDCQKKQNECGRERYRKAKEDGECTRCRKKKASENKTICVDCLAHLNREGICSRCRAKPAEEGKSKCAECKNAIDKYYEDHKEELASKQQARVAAKKGEKATGEE